MNKVLEENDKDYMKHVGGIEAYESKEFHKKSIQWCCEYVRKTRKSGILGVIDKKRFNDANNWFESKFGWINTNNKYNYGTLSDTTVVFDSSTKDNKTISSSDNKNELRIVDGDSLW